MPPPDPETLVLYDLADPPTLDPARTWGFFDGRLIGLVFSNLVRFDAKAKIVPDLAVKWDISEDGKTYTFTLNPQAKFSFGRAVTAEDVVYSFERIREQSHWITETIQHVEAVAPGQVVFRLRERFSPFPGLLAMPAAAIVPRESVAEREESGIPFGEQPVGSGPWVFREWQHDQYILLERNEHYWGRKPEMPRLLYRIINNPFTAIAEFEVGNVAVIEPLPEAEILRWRTHPQWRNHVLLSQLLNTDMLIFNCEKSPTNQVEFRRALCQAVKSSLLLEAIREGAGVVSTGPIPPGIRGHDPQQSPLMQDVEAARATVERLGLDEQELILLLPSTEGFVQTTGEVMQALWKEIGLTVRILKMEWVTYRTMLRNGEFDIAYRSWFADYPDGDNFLYPLFHSSQIPNQEQGGANLARFSHPEVDDLIRESQQELDEGRREALLRQADDLIFEQAPALFLWHRANYSVIQPWLRDYTVPLIFNGTQFLDEKIVKVDKRF
ncbi:MAG: ABC transporter substrate-binding protein [bacterium]